MIPKTVLLDNFFVESEEQVATLEDGLVELEKTPNDAEVLNRIFRAAHTLKGNAGMVGLPDIVEFAHLMENVLDRLRERQMSADRRVISILLAAIDVVKAMVNLVAKNQSASEAPKYREIEQQLSSLLPNADGLAKEKDSTQREIVKDASNVKNKRRTYRIVIKSAAVSLESGQDPYLIIRELGEMGDIQKLVVDTSRIPVLRELVPHRLYLEWEIVLVSAATKEEIEGVFLFVDNRAAIVLEEIADSKPESNAAIAEKKIGQLLVDEGLVSDQDIKEALAQQKRLGEILVATGKVKREQLETALGKQEAARNQLYNSSIRVATDKLDRLVNLVGEMVIALAQAGRAVRDAHAAAESRISAIEGLERIGRDLQEQVMTVRMVPIGDTFSRFKRVVRDLANEQGKLVDMEMSGTETELDKNVIEQLVDPLKHMLRNCIAHGLESPEDRRAAGKLETGKISLHAEQREGHIVIEIADDGRGINTKRVLAKAIEQGLVRADAGLTQDEIINLIFAPGLSTASAINEISGRGVGLDVVRQNVNNLRGKITVRTTPGKGTTFVIMLPLTLAIIDGMNVQVGNKCVVVPLLSVVELVAASSTEIVTVEGKGELVCVGKEHLPLIRLSSILDYSEINPSDDETIVIVESSHRRLGLLVNKVLGVEQAVIKPLGSSFSLFAKANSGCRIPESVAGATILGDGSVGLILDVHGIERNAFGVAA